MCKGVSLTDAVLVGVAVVLLVTAAMILCAKRATRRQTAVGRILSLVAEESHLLIPATVCLFLSSGLQMLIPYFGGEFIALVSHPDGVSQESLNDLMISIMVTSIFMSITTCVRGALYNLAGEKIICRLRQRVFASLLQQEIAFFDEQTSGALVSRLTSDTATLQACASSYISMGLRSLANLIMSLAILLVISWKLTLTMLAVVPAVSVLAGVMMRMSRKISERCSVEPKRGG